MPDAEPHIYRSRPVQLNWREVEGEIVVLDLRKKSYLSLNSSGVVLWKRLVDGASKPELTDALVEAYRIDADVALTDVEAFLAMLNARGLLA